MTPETAFVAWLASRPALAGRLRGVLPHEVLSDQAHQAVQAIQAGTFSSNGQGTDVSDACAIGFLRTQLLAVLGQAAARAQRADQTGQAYAQVVKAAELLHGLDDVFGEVPLVSFEDAIPEPRDFLPTGIQALDAQIAGLAASELGIVAMSPGRGKTHILINFAANALKTGATVHYVTVADAGLHELIPRIDACVLNRPTTGPETSAEDLQHTHAEAVSAIAGRLWISDFTDRECSLASLESVIGDCQSDLVIIDHADDVAPPFGDPGATRHSLRIIYKELKQFAVRYHVPIWTASQTPELAWFYDSAGISELAEAKTGKASGAAIVLVFSAGKQPVPGTIYCTIAKARRRFSRRTFPLHVDYARVQTW